MLELAPFVERAGEEPLQLAAAGFREHAGANADDVIDQQPHRFLDGLADVRGEGGPLPRFVQLRFENNDKLYAITRIV